MCSIDFVEWDEQQPRRRKPKTTRTQKRSGNGLPVRMYAHAVYVYGRATPAASRRRGWTAAAQTKVRSRHAQINATQTRKKQSSNKSERSNALQSK